MLALTGDHVVVGDHKEAKPVFDLDSVQILETIAALNGGHDLMGNELHGTPEFFVGAVVTPGRESHSGRSSPKFDKKVARRGAVLPDAGGLRHRELSATSWSTHATRGAKVLAGHRRAALGDAWRAS